MTPANKKFRVLIVDDSTFMCRVLRDIISSDPQLEVVGQARDGSEAVSQADSLEPDVITMDINMPRVDGLEATEMIMTRHPRPIVIVSSESREGASSTLRALELGAVDFVSKPSTGIDLDMKTVASELTRKLKLAAKVRVVRTAALSKIPARQAPAAASSCSTAAVQSGGRSPMVAIAASTGGPAAVMRLVSGLPAEMCAPVFLVLHMPAAFTKQFAAQLGEVSRLPVKEAEHNEVPLPGTIYLCPGSHHLRISSTGSVVLDPGARIDGYRPCADLAFETLASYARSLATGVVLTGMGADAARGAKAIKAAGGFVLAQDEASSVIFGMPSEAIKAGAVDQVLPLDEIAGAIERRVAKLSRLVPAVAP
jgi:two-component system, chemotaxis family, protein-glutamate methylesterase/glutaminase